jgi:hypothetical protein
MGRSLFFHRFCKKRTIKKIGKMNPIRSTKVTIGLICNECLITNKKLLNNMESMLMLTK